MTTITREQQEQLVLDYLCYNQMGEHALGQDSAGCSVEIQWVECRCAWQIIETDAEGNISIDYESGGCEHAVGGLSDEILADMIEELGLELEDAE